VLGWFYDALDRPPSPRRKSDRLRYLVQKLNLRPLLAKLTEKKWDLFVNTHFLPAEMIAHLKRKGRITAPQFTVTTDFETHRLWVNPPCERYFTATDEGAEYLVHWGVPRGDVSVTGIPIDPVFRTEKPRAELLAKHGLDGRAPPAEDAPAAGRAPVILQLAGGFGVGPIEEIFRAILSLEKPVDLIVVAGRNEAARAQLEKIATSETPERHRTRVLGFTTEIDELMALADVVVSKPGGLTTSETLARGAAMAIVNPIPGQESRNSDWLLENGVAIKINHIATLPLKLGGLLAVPRHLATMRTRARELGRPEAAFTIAAEALRTAQGTPR
jgi:processive 1,2-diacylglycerol beta-glucosyltransferase